MIAFPPSLLDQLEHIATNYIDAHQLCRKQQAHLRRHVRDFRRWRDGRVACAQTAALNEWLAALAERLAPATVNGYRTSLLTLLRFATPEEEPLPRADRIRRQREPDAIKTAFTQEEIRQLIAAAPQYCPLARRVYGHGQARSEVARQMPDGRAWSIWWEAFTRAAYDSGQYLADLRLLRWRDVRPDGSATIVRHKTGRFITFRLRDTTLAACRRLDDRELLLPWRWNAEGYFCREWKKFVQFAGVRELGAKSLRRSAITYTYMQFGEEAARTLAGHASFATTSRHYIDWSIASRPTVQPPPL